MSLSGSRLNGARYTSALADVTTQFPISGGLLPAEQAQLGNFQEKLAHAIADHHGTDTVEEITANAEVPLGISVNIPTTASPGSPSVGATDAKGTVE